jgi:hypothetical protein
VPKAFHVAVVVVVKRVLVVAGPRMDEPEKEGPCTFKTGPQFATFGANELGRLRTCFKVDCFR